MSRLLPFRADDSPSPGEQTPRVVDLEGDDADKVFSALSSDTARQIYTCLNEEPRTPSDVAEAIDSSIQNVRYHLEKLEDAGLIEVVDVWYSSRGNEMNVYAPASGPLIVSGDEQQSSRIRGALSRLVGGIGALAAGSLFVQYALPRLLGGPTAVSSGGDPGGEGGSGDGGSGGGDVGISAQDNGASGRATTTQATGTDGGGTVVEQGTTQPATTGTSDAVATSTRTEAATQTATAPPTEAATKAAEATQTAVTDGGQTTTHAADTVASGADAAFASIPPGALFFAGGLCVLVVVVGIWYYRGEL
ncbi:ArsR/SmtB family transcription factor [Haloarchaeobius sp. TZWWS8]|uniref:ArsR/SmtB family transcription factor n=1 Tax=Haloarchaeobius sp. TZWWS8 TaxID=3446121 RepID=UPI003EB6B7E5